jgi:vitamin-K-epoxide reductase (warfarin-sensitive)
MVNSSIKKILWVVFALSLVALPITGYLIYLHFVPESGEFCNFNEQFNCDVVNKSQWSYVDLGFMEVPVALMGFKTYAIFAVLSLLLIKGVDFRRLFKFLSDRVVLWLMMVLSVLGFLFSAYLTYIEAFVLYTFCIFCLASQFLIAAIMGLLILAVYKMRRVKG